MADDEKKIGWPWSCCSKILRAINGDHEEEMRELRKISADQQKIINLLQGKQAVKLVFVSAKLL